MEDPYISDASFANQYLQNEELTKVWVISSFLSFFLSFFLFFFHFSFFFNKNIKISEE